MRKRATLLGSCRISEGRIASCASWALPRERYAGGASGTYSRPTRATIQARASACASRATRTESVRM